MFASRLFPSIIPLLITLTLLATEFATQVIGKEENHIGKEHVVECDDGIGDTTLFTTTIKSLLPGDSLLLGPCNYQFEDDYIIGQYNAPDSDKFETFGIEGVLIKGTGQNPDQTVLNAIIKNFPVNVMFENLKINGIKSTDSVFFTEDMNGIYVLFRSCVLIAGDLSTAYMKTAVYAYNGKLTFIDSKIINGYPSATESVVGVSVEAFDERYFYRSSNKLTLMRSSIEYFPIGLLGGNWTADSQNSIQVHKTKLSSNTIKCCAYTVNGCDICPLDSQTMNTPEGKSKIEMNEMVDLLGADTYNYINCFSTSYTLDLTIPFRKVQTGGSTLGYKLLSAHPALPMYKDKQYHPGNAAPQYFQFDSSATFSNEKGNRIGFDKSVIDSNFNNPNKIKAFQSVDGKVWKNKPLKVKVKVIQVKIPKSNFKKDTTIYQVKIPKRKKLKILIAFGER